MGIDGLPKLINDIVGSYAMKTYDLERFKGMKVAVDASLMIYQTVIALRASGKDLKNKKGELTSHLHGLFYKILNLLENKIEPIFVYDGKAPDIKNKTIQLRKERKNNAEETLKDLSDSEDELYIKKFKESFKPSKQDYIESQILLDLMGIPYIIAPGEADVVCAWLTTRKDNNDKRYVKGVCSDDSDMLPLGALYLFKDMLRFMTKRKKVMVINLNRVLNKMDLTLEQFQDMCVLLGCDYCDKIKGIGPKRAYQFIKIHESLENIVEFLQQNPKFKTPIDLDCLITARNYFRTAVNDLDDNTEFVLTDDNLKLRTYQYNELVDFMCTKHNFDFQKIHTGIERLKECYDALNITRENNKKVHKMIRPNKFSHMLVSEDSIDLLTDSESDDDSTSNKFKKIPNKKTTKISKMKKKSKNQ